MQTPRACAKVAAELGTKAVHDYRELFGAVDAVSLAVPTPLHLAIGCELLKNGIDVLMEKPIATTVAEARELVDLARTHKRILQVGHLERFNPAVLAAVSDCRRRASSNPIDSRRSSSAAPDVSVVLDLMIHDIDLIQELVGTPIERIDAVGATVFSGEIDIVNARLRFQGGCVANTTASRISLKQERKIRIFQDDAYLSVDMQQKILTVIRKKDARAGGVARAGVDRRRELRSGRCVAAPRSKRS